MKDHSSKNSRENVDSPAGRDYDLEILDQSGSTLETNDDDSPTTTKRRDQGWLRLSITITAMTLVSIIIIVLRTKMAKQFPNSTDSVSDSDTTCTDSCRMNLVESIPVGLVYPNDSVLHPSIYHSWMKLISLAQSSIDIATPHLGLRREEANYTGDGPKQGEDVFEAFLKAGRDRGIRLRVLRGVPKQLNPEADSEYLTREAKAQVRILNFTKIFGHGYMHTKLWVIDRKHFYLGSANANWQALTQFRELGLLAVNCSCLAKDAAKIFEMYWKLYEDGIIPTTWPESLETSINVGNPMDFVSGGNRHRVFLASSPPALLPKGRTDDLDAILHCINKAEKFIDIDMMKYYPLMLYLAKPKYWPIIDDALRAAAIERNVHIRMLINWWENSDPSQDYFLRSLTALSGSYENVRIEVKYFIIPKNKQSYKMRITGLCHNKYLVTDEAAYVSSSNLVGDYFLDTAGIGIVFEKEGHEDAGSIRRQLRDKFNRDWTSRYTHPLNTTYADRRRLKYAGL